MSSGLEKWQCGAMGCTAGLDECGAGGACMWTRASGDGLTWVAVLHTSFNDVRLLSGRRWASHCSDAFLEASDDSSHDAWSAKM